MKRHSWVETTGKLIISAAKKATFHLDKEGFENVGVDQLALPGRQQWLDKDSEDRLGEIKAGEKGRRDRCDAPQQAPAKLDQMIEQRRFALIDVADHGSGRSSGGVGSSSGAAGASSGKSGWTASNGGEGGEGNTGSG
jgi:hypothetical protein